MSRPAENENQTVERLAKTVGAPVADGNGNWLYAALPDGVRIHDLERFLQAPRRQRGYVILHDAPSFGAFVKGHSERTILFADKLRLAFTAVFNPGAAKRPDFGDHGASLTLRHSTQWGAWSARHKAWSDQDSFAEFLEDRLEDVVEPVSADLLAVATNLQAKKNVNYKSGISLANGAIQFEYDEQVEAKGKGLIEVPEKFVIGIPVFEGGAPYRITARLRWRIAPNKQLMFRFDLANYELVKENAFDVELHKIEEATGLKALMGESEGLDIGT